MRVYIVGVDKPAYPHSRKRIVAVPYHQVDSLPATVLDNSILNVRAATQREAIRKYREHEFPESRSAT